MSNPCKPIQLSEAVIEQLAEDVTPLVLESLRETGFVVTGNVQTYNDLPNAADATNLMFSVLSGLGTPGLPVWEGGSYYPRGYYVSDGLQWNYIVETFFDAYSNYLNPYIFTQVTPLSTWNITHTLDRIVSNVTVLDNSGNVVLTDIKIVDEAHVEIKFSKPFSGKAIIF
jgi:hypothetical protein